MMIKRIIKKIPGVPALYRRLHVAERVQFFKQRGEMKEFAKRGDRVIEHIHQVLSQSGNMFFVDAGTLIGIYRDGRLLKRDMDVDMGVVTHSQADVLKIRELLIANGFQLKIIFSTPSNGIIQDAFEYDGVRVDMCYFRGFEDSDVCYLLYADDKIIKMTFSKISSTKPYKYRDQIVFIPDNSEKYLEERYGKSWRVPDPFFKYWEGPCVTPEDGVGICEFVD